VSKHELGEPEDGAPLAVADADAEVRPVPDSLPMQGAHVSSIKEAMTTPSSAFVVRGADPDWIKANNQDKPTVRRVTLPQLSQPMKCLGSGEFCSAFLTTLDGKPVVVKMLKPEQRDNATAAADLKSEMHLMAYMDHPNILRALAMGEHDERPFLVLERLSTILSAELPKPAESVPFWTRRSGVRKWPLRRALTVALQLAEALDYCHSGCFPGLRVLHRDLKPNNIGFLADGRLALFDFGLAKLWRIGPDDQGGTEVRPLTGNTGSLRYMAPEVALSKAYSHRAEVFAFATLVWQMVSHDRPYADCDVQSFYRRVCHAGERPKIPSGTPKELTVLLEQCWHVDSSKRPEFAQIIPRLKAVLAEAGGE